MRKLLTFALMAVLLCSCSSSQQETSIDDVKCIDDLNGHTVSVILGSIQDIGMSKTNPEINLMRLGTPSEVLASVEKGKSEFCMSDTVLYIGYDTKKNGLQYCFSETVYGGNIALGFRHSDTLLCREFNDFLAEFKASGQHAESLEFWLKSNIDSVDVPVIETPTEGEPIVVGISPMFPFTFVKNGKYAGFEIEMLQRFAAASGHPIRLDMYDFGAMITALGTHKIDVVCAFMTETEERAKQVLFSDDYFFCNAACFGKINKQVEKKGLSWARIEESFKNNLIVESRWKMILQGLWETLVISFFAVIIGTLIGALFCWIKMSRIKILKKILKVFLDILAGIPMLVFLMVMFYVVFATSSLTGRWIAIIAFAINFGSFVSEVFHSSIEGIDKGQTEAGLAMGFSQIRTFTTFILPQAIKKIIPLYKSEIIAMMKNTSVVGYIAIQDLTKMSDLIRSRTFDAFFPLLTISVIYFILAWLISRALDLTLKKIK